MRRTVPDTRGAGIAGAGGSALLVLARAVRAVVGLIVTVIVVAILLRVLEADRDNAIVELFDDVARALVGPFDGIFDLDNAKTEIAVNWGLAAVAYSVVGGFIATLIARAGLAGTSRRRR